MRKQEKYQRGEEQVPINFRNLFGRGKTKKKTHRGRYYTDESKRRRQIGKHQICYYCGKPAGIQTEALVKVHGVYERAKIWVCSAHYGKMPSLKASEDSAIAE
jgi:hypothetical protein